MPTLPAFRPNDDHLDVFFASKLAGARETRVREHDHPAHLLRARKQPPRQCDRLGDPGRSVARGDRIERSAKRALVVGRPADDARGARRRR